MEWNEKSRRNGMKTKKFLKSRENAEMEGNLFFNGMME
jgi:hypothetical protein